MEWGVIVRGRGAEGKKVVGCTWAGRAKELDLKRPLGGVEGNRHGGRMPGTVLKGQLCSL